MGLLDDAVDPVEEERRERDEESDEEKSETIDVEDLLEGLSDDDDEKEDSDDDDVDYAALAEQKGLNQDTQWRDVTAKDSAQAKEKKVYRLPEICKPDEKAGFARGPVLTRDLAFRALQRPPMYWNDLAGSLVRVVENSGTAGGEGHTYMLCQFVGFLKGDDGEYKVTMGDGLEKHTEMEIHLARGTAQRTFKLDVVSNDNKVSDREWESYERWVEQEAKMDNHAEMLNGIVADGKLDELFEEKMNKSRQELEKLANYKFEEKHINDMLQSGTMDLSLSSVRYREIHEAVTALRQQIAQTSYGPARVRELRDKLEVELEALAHERQEMNKTRLHYEYRGNENHRIFEITEINNRNKARQDELDQALAVKEKDLAKAKRDGTDEPAEDGEDNTLNPFARRECNPRNMWDMKTHVKEVEAKIKSTGQIIPDEEDFSPTKKRERQNAADDKKKQAKAQKVLQEAVNRGQREDKMTSTVFDMVNKMWKLDPSKKGNPQTQDALDRAAKRRKVDSNGKANGNGKLDTLAGWIEFNASQPQDFVKYKGETYNRADLVARGIYPPVFPDDFDSSRKNKIMDEWKADRERRKMSGTLDPLEQKEYRSPRVSPRRQPIH